MEKIYFTRIPPIGLLNNKVLNNNVRWYNRDESIKAKLLNSGKSKQPMKTINSLYQLYSYISIVDLQLEQLDIFTNYHDC